jgi:hypothetical protein
LKFALIVAIAGVLGGSVIIAGIFSQNFGGLKHDLNADAAHMPLDVTETFTSRQRGADALGGSIYVQVDEEFVDDDSHCEFCIAIEYKPGPQGKALIAFTRQDPIDIGDAKKLSFAARGQEGGESINIYAAGAKEKSSPGKEEAGLSSPEHDGVRGIKFSATGTITLGKSWQVYELYLPDTGLSEITHGFAFEVLKGKGDERQVVYLDSIIFSR